MKLVSKKKITRTLKDFDILNNFFLENLVWDNFRRL